MEEETDIMAVKIRLTRLGRKKLPYYRIVVADVEAKRDGKFLDIVGTYDPLKDPVEVHFDASSPPTRNPRKVRPNSLYYERADSLYCGRPR